MMNFRILLFSLISFILYCQPVYGIPVTKGIEDIQIVTTYLPSYATVLISLGALLLFAYFVLGCVCCPNKSIKALSYQNGFPVSRLNENNFENPAEITIFPPHSTVIDLQPVSPSFPGYDDKVTFEPLPDILPKKFTSGQSAACSSRPAHFSALLKSKVSLHDWFDDPNSNFPREQLQYLQEIGCGWFGRIVEGEASQICDNEEKTSVIVKILREEASPSEHLHFLHEVRPYRDLKHPNVVQLLGRCLETDPFLLIMEHSTCDLKSYLIKQDNKDSFMKDGFMLQMISNIAAGLRYMHEKGFCHMDLAAHNCFVCSDSTVKIGDYGVSFDRWKNDYYCLGDIALPIRWYSPEILKCSDTTIETKEITREANVWAFGVVLWEIVEFGKLPYGDLSDEEVLQKVLIEKSVQLLPPSVEIPNKHEISLVMKECWKHKKYRPPMEKIENFVTQLYNDRLNIKNKELSFEERWNAIQPKITEISSYTGTESSSLKFENDFSTKSDLQNYSSDNEILSSFEMSFDILPKTEFNGHLSPSLNVLNGSIDELTENDANLNSISLSCGKYDADTLSNISDKDNFQMEEDKDNFHPNNMISEQISAAIRDLDLVLASQPDSSRNSTLQKSTKPVFIDSENAERDKEVHINGVSSELKNLSKSSDLSNISESSYSKSSNLSDHLDPVVNEKCDSSMNSDMNGNCNFYNAKFENVNSAKGESYGNKVCNDSACNSEHKKTDTAVVDNLHVVDPGSLEKVTDKLFDLEKDDELIQTENTEKISNSENVSSVVPDIVIHESSSLNAPENFSEFCESENNQKNFSNQSTHKTFRFVFKDIPDQDQETIEISHKDFGEELVHDLRESLKKNYRSTPLTSTPVKTNSDSFSSAIRVNGIIKNDTPNDVFYEPTPVISSENVNISTNALDHNSEMYVISNISGEDLPFQNNSNCDVDFNTYGVQNSDSNQLTTDSTNIDSFTTAQSSLCLSKSNDFTEDKFSETSCLREKSSVFQIENDITLNCNIENNEKILSDTFEKEKSSDSNTLYVSADSDILLKEDYSKVSDVISPPNGYISANTVEIKIDYADMNDDTENDYLENSKASETVSPPQAFQDDGLAALNDSFSESKASLDQEFSTSAECGSNENLEQYLEDDISQTNISAAKLLETSFPEVESKSFTYEACADFSGNMRPRKNGSGFNFLDSDKKNTKSYHSEFVNDECRNYNPYENIKQPIQTYDQMIVEDLDTGEQTVINESYSVCDDYENSGESDEILKINTETDEAIIVDSSEALIGFVPSRSIELLQEFDVIPPLNPSYTLDEEKESSDSMNIDAYNSASPSPAAMKHTSSPYESPESTYPQQPYRNFCLQNEVIEEEITDEIVSPSSFHSSSSYCSNEIFMDEEKMSQSSESVHHGEMFETSVMPSVDHLYVESDDGSKTDVSSSECSPVKENQIVNAKYRTDSENNHITDDQEDVMHSYQPTQSVRWLSDETLDVEGDDQSPIIIEGREILAGDIIQTCELTAEDIASALNQLEAKGHLHGLTPNHLNVSQSPSPFSSVESSPCRDTVYTPDFESDSEETGSGTSCSSTSGSFECIHNKFKNVVDISKAADESDKSVSSREQSPMKIFSKTWDCHATPTKGVLVTPEKKFNSMRKSVSFHEEDPQVVFEYPPASDSSEDGYPSDDNEEFCQNIDYLKYADWDLQVGDADDVEIEEVIEIEELDSEPYVRRPSYSSSSVGPLNRPMLYTLTTGFSDEDFDLSETVPPSLCAVPLNSPDEEKGSSNMDSNISELIQSHLNTLMPEESSVKVTESDSDILRSGLDSVKGNLPAPMMSVQESAVSSVMFDDIFIDELLPEQQASCDMKTVHKENCAKSDFDVSFDDYGIDEEEIIVEELPTDDSEPENSDSDNENRVIVLETDSIIGHNNATDSKSEKADKMFSELNVEELETASSFEMNTREFSQIVKDKGAFIANSSGVTKAFVVEHENVGATIFEDALNSEVSKTNNLVETEDGNQEISALKLSDKTETTLDEIIKESSCPEDILINWDDRENLMETDDIEHGNKDINSKLETSFHGPSKSHVIVIEIPVHTKPYDSNSEAQDASDCHVTSNNSSKISFAEFELVSDDATESSTLPVQSSVSSVQENTSTPVSNSEKTANSRTKTVGMSNNINCSTDEKLSVVDNEKPELNISLSESNLVCTMHQSETDLTLNKSNRPNEISSKSHENKDNILENNPITSENSFRDDGNIAQNAVQLNESSSRILSNSSEDCSVDVEGKMCNVQKENPCSHEYDSSNTAPSTDLPVAITFDSSSQKETNVILPADAVLGADLPVAILPDFHNEKGVDVILSATSISSIDLPVIITSESCAEEGAVLPTNSGCNMDLPVIITPDSPDGGKAETVCDSFCVEKHDNTLSILHIPKIVVTPASESEEELEEYLRGQLEHFHSEASPQEDFSVTSEYSSRPFDDVFGSYVSGDSSDYIEAFNFEFDNGNFFEDYIDDYPHDLETGVNDRLCPNNGQQKRSSSLPLMTENLSDDDSLTMKSDSSLMYDSLKGVTRL